MSSLQSDHDPIRSIRPVDLRWNFSTPPKNTLFEPRLKVFIALTNALTPRGLGRSLLIRRIAGTIVRCGVLERHARAIDQSGTRAELHVCAEAKPGKRARHRRDRS